MDSVRSKTLYWLLALLFAVPLLYFALRGIQWARVAETMGGARAGHMALACALITGTLLLRSLRWRLLLLAEGNVTVPGGVLGHLSGIFR